MVRRAKASSARGFRFYVCVSNQVLIDLEALLTSMADGRGRLARVRRIRNMRDLREAMCVASPADRFILEPAHAIGMPWKDHIVELASRSKSDRIVAVCEPDADPHALHWLMSSVQCALIVIGVDDERALRGALWPSGQETPPVSVAELIAAARGWPRAMREAIMRCIQDPGSWTVKRLVAESLFARRTLERYFAAAGLPGPANVLRCVRRAVTTT